MLELFVCSALLLVSGALWLVWASRRADTAVRRWETQRISDAERWALWEKER